MFDAREKITHEKYLESFGSELQMKKDLQPMGGKLQ